MSRCRFHLGVVRGLALTGLHIVQSREGIATVSSTTAPEFGPNDWFVEEKYNQFLSDPSSVDQIWRDFFTDPVAESRKANQVNGAPGGHGAPGAAGVTIDPGAAPVASAPKAQAPAAAPPTAPVQAAPVQAAPVQAAPVRAVGSTPPPPPPP